MIEYLPYILRRLFYNPVFIFLIFTLLFSSVIWVLTLNAPDGGRIAARIYGYGIMWCPALATWVTCRIFNRRITDLAWSWKPTNYLTAAYLIPLGYSLTAYLIIWTTGWGGFYNKAYVSGIAHELGWEGLPPYLFIVLYLVAQGVIGIFSSIATALGEEIGWRGFLVPELSKRFGFGTTSLITGLIWAAWHYPLLIFGHYNNGTPVWYGLTCFTISVIAASYIYTWFTLKSGSFWTAVLLHASHNLFIQAFFTPITVNKKSTAWYSDEFGAVVPALTVMVAVYFWTRRKELLQTSTAANITNQSSNTKHETIFIKLVQ
ncbi:type II CAAX endopeptidase family protein [Pedobacter miscanthi]|uniref:CPBP family intramembrane glutamic endopeptidase n=1 Tax=Pedobacter miscanthi TaxID=2259170 RepID=UPI00292DA73F|nr:type II CAAX endopeptidase family protein [Pedobacter miscanthi]